MSILHVEGNSGAFVGRSGCGFEFCPMCNSSPVPVDWRDGRPNIASWLFTIEEWLVQGLVERILEERGWGSYFVEEEASSESSFLANETSRHKKHPGYGNSP